MTPPGSPALAPMIRVAFDALRNSLRYLLIVARQTCGSKGAVAMSFGPAPPEISGLR
jgi:hypothetical protein